MLWWISNCHNLIDCLIVKWNEILKQEKIYSKAIIVIAKLCAMALIPPISPPMIFVRKKMLKAISFLLLLLEKKNPNDVDGVLLLSHTQRLQRNEWERKSLLECTLASLPLRNIMVHYLFLNAIITVAWVVVYLHKENGVLEVANNKMKHQKIDNINKLF